MGLVGFLPKVQKAPSPKNVPETPHMHHTMQQLDKKVVIEAYRSLYKAGLRAVCFSVPARYMVRDSLRKAFRDGPLGDFNQKRINNTIGFLDQASKAKGIEHKILKNLVHVRYYERHQTRATADFVPAVGKQAPMKGFAPIPWTSQERKDGYRAFDNALKMFNDNHQLCLG